MIPQPADPDCSKVGVTLAGTEGVRLEVLAAVVGRYRAIPGLSLTAAQSAHVFSLQIHICETLLNELVDAGWLRRSLDGQYRLV